MGRIETQRLTLNMPTELMARLDEYSSKMNISRTSGICVLLTQALDGQKAVSELGELLALVKAENDAKTSKIKE